eukprot:TRINITY_DN3912_c0_g1_i1.p1 TRINITY_DN3912_c0_g1~~TRINITY_DN3912_c0_g1_i1.p1  ORF type:complete len:165 (+),score=13.20 TRINITY_DN3912_c0_g1_i1:290-784(+)
MAALNAGLFHLSKMPNLSVGVCGGSHGGFLTTHMIGQYPNRFKVAVSRNPVVDLSNMLASTDIPDWVVYESGMSADSSVALDMKGATRLWEASPCQYVDKIKTPLLILLGAKDQRVPMQGAIRLYKQLRARGRDVQMNLTKSYAQFTGGCERTIRFLVCICFVD